jgi:hypothetical protein
MIEPSPQRRQHDRIVRDEQQLADSAGLIGVPWRAEGLLARLERHGDIGRRERAAGEQFAQWFHLAHLDPLKAHDIEAGERTIHTSTGIHSSERARQRINLALDALGGLDGLCGSCAWQIVGTEMTLAEWAQRQRWAGKRITPTTAKGVLLATLNQLAAHFGA